MTTSAYILSASLFTYQFVLLVLVVVMFASYKRQSPDFRWLSVFAGISLLTDVLGLVFYFLTDINNNYPSNVYDLLTTPVLSLFFYFAIASPKLKTPLLVANVILFILSLLNIMFLQGPEIINSYPAIATAIVVITLSIVFFYRLLQQLPTQQIQRLPLFWVISGLFLSFSGKLVVYSVQHYMIQILGDNMRIVQTFHNILSLICYGLILVGVLVKASNKKMSGSTETS